MWLTQVGHQTKSVRSCWKKKKKKTHRPPPLHFHSAEDLSTVLGFRGRLSRHSPTPQVQSKTAGEDAGDEAARKSSPLVDRKVTRVLSFFPSFLSSHQLNIRGLCVFRFTQEAERWQEFQKNLQKMELDTSREEQETAVKTYVPEAEEYVSSSLQQFAMEVSKQANREQTKKRRKDSKLTLFTLFHSWTNSSLF
jgi:hypothetical protein